MLGNELAAQVSSSECRDGVRHRCLDLGQRGVIGVDCSSLVLVELGPRHRLETLASSSGTHFFTSDTMYIIDLKNSTVATVSRTTLPDRTAIWYNGPYMQ